jgi:hypothetical protein
VRQKAQGFPGFEPFGNVARNVHQATRASIVQSVIGSEGRTYITVTNNS